jgi:hypothetical protein
VKWGGVTLVRHRNVRGMSDTCDLGQNRVKRKGMGERKEELLGIVMLPKLRTRLIACEELGIFLAILEW